MKRNPAIISLLVVISMMLCFAMQALAQIEVIDEKTVKVKAFGIAKKKKVKLATSDAVRNAVEMVVNEIIRDQVEREAFDMVKAEFLAEPMKYVNDYNITKNYVDDAKKQHIGISAIINKDLIQQNLVDLGVVSAAKETRKALDRFTIMPYLDLDASSPEAAEWKELFYTRVRAFFEDQGIPTVGQDEAMAAEADEEMLAKMKSSTAGEDEEDPALQIARNTPADIFVKIVAKIDKGSYAGTTTYKVILTIGSYTVMTGEFIGSGQGFSEPMALSSSGASIAAGIDQAMNSAMNTVMDRLTMFWRDFVKNGKPVKVIFTDFSFGEVGKIKKSLGDITNDLKLLKRAGNVTEYMVWYDGSAEDLMYEVYDAAGIEAMGLSEDPSIISNTIRFHRKP